MHLQALIISVGKIIEEPNYYNKLTTWLSTIFSYLKQIFISKGGNNFISQVEDYIMQATFVASFTKNTKNISVS